MNKTEYQLIKLPKGWKQFPLGALVQAKPGNNKLIKGKQFKEPSPGRYPGYSASGQDIYCTVAEYDREGIVLSAVGARCGKCFIAEGKWTAVANTHVILPNPELVKTRFMWYLLNDENFWIKSGTAQPFVSVNKSMEILVALPPLPEQRRIVEAIELQLGRLDAAVARLHAAKAKLKRYKQAVLKAAVEGMLTDPDLSEGELPDDWTWTTLGEVVELVSGGTPKGLNESATGGSIPFFKVGDMTLEGNDHYMESSRTYLTEAEAKRLKLTVHPAGTVIFPKRGGAILTNKKRVLSNPGAFDLNLMGALPNDEVDGDFLFYWFEQLDLSKVYDGSNIPQINKKNVDPLPFAKPTLKEQRRIAAELDRLLSSSNETEATLEAQLAQAARLRQSVLKRAFEGRLV
ncbi:MAG TPA: restriction endonuclease subunit S [Flavobacteriales bacterium]|nr:restriction endonuclease subunit S [Flavobacteriales bacterium]